MSTRNRCFELLEISNLHHFADKIGFSKSTWSIVMEYNMVPCKPCQSTNHIFGRFDRLHSTAVSFDQYSIVCDQMNEVTLSIDFIKDFNVYSKNIHTESFIMCATHHYCLYEFLVDSVFIPIVCEREDIWASKRPWQRLSCELFKTVFSDQFSFYERCRCC